MTARNIFNDILKKVETSQLNYAVSKTPFSATISLKCSLVKRSDDSSSESQNIVSEEPMNLKETSDKEIAKLKYTIEVLQNTVTEQKCVIDKQSKQMKNTAKSIDNDKSEMREELLKVKRERNNFGLKVKTLENEIDMLRADVNSLKDENKELIQKGKENTDEIKHLKKDNASLEKLNRNLKQNLEKEYENPQYKCEQCDLKTRCQNELKVHKQAYHTKDSSNQVEVEDKPKDETRFASYPCFYCQKYLYQPKIWKITNLFATRLKTLLHFHVMCLGLNVHWKKI